MLMVGQYIEVVVDQYIEGSDGVTLCFSVRLAIKQIDSNNCM